MPPLCDTSPIGPRGKVIHRQRARGRQHDVVREVHEADRVGAEDAHRAGSFHELLLAAAPSSPVSV